VLAGVHGLGWLHTTRTREAFAPLAPQHQGFFTVEPVDPLVVDDETITTQ
jgi:hypothetical protein